ncbi:MAG: vitamin B12 dependent-methionine synthase activation domain-containing protein [Prolixibacteraceae bacterium]|jgi:hypothetical protein|nr:vitamin B12 dependent-methionine synthase activation domain-containing protein [Prolixibacteraceae bacterium]
MIKEFSFKFNELVIDRSQVSATLGFPGVVPEPFDSYLDEAWQFAEGLNDIRAAYTIRDRIVADERKSELTVEGITFKVGRTIRHEIAGSGQIAFFICTAGETVSRRAKALLTGEDPALGYVYDVLGSYIAEAAGDAMQARLGEETRKSGRQLTNRYSPGYCQWLVTDQRKLFGLFNGIACGVSLTDSALMDPIKSISGLIGIGPNVQYREYQCELCNLKKCLYQKIHEQY